MLDRRSLIRLTVEYSRGVMIVPFWLYGGVQMSDLVSYTYRFSPNKLIYSLLR